MFRKWWPSAITQRAKGHNKELHNSNRWCLSIC